MLFLLCFTCYLPTSHSTSLFELNVHLKTGATITNFDWLQSFLPFFVVVAAWWLSSSSSSYEQFISSTFYAFKFLPYICVQHCCSVSIEWCSIFIHEQCIIELSLLAIRLPDKFTYLATSLDKLNLIRNKWAGNWFAKLTNFSNCKENHFNFISTLWNGLWLQCVYSVSWGCLCLCMAKWEIAFDYISSFKND